MNNQIEKKDKMEKPLEPMLPHPILERKSSIDAEPKTLSPDELNSAREAALKIINTHTKEEALKIFMVGLVPVASSLNAKEEAVVSGCDSE